MTVRLENENEDEDEDEDEDEVKNRLEQDCQRHTVR